MAPLRLPTKAGQRCSDCSTPQSKNLGGTPVDMNRAGKAQQADVVPLNSKTHPSPTIGSTRVAASGQVHPRATTLRAQPSMPPTWLGIQVPAQLAAVTQT
jgi:hypothetical protein